MRARRAYAAAAGAIGAAALLVAPFAGSAPAGEPLPIYSARGAGKGVEMTFALRPNIFDPLLHAAAGYAQTKVDSAGGGESRTVAGSAYPGDLILGARGCAGLRPFVVEAAYPAHNPKDPSKRCGTRTPQQEDTFIPIPAGPLTIAGGNSRAAAGFADARGRATLGRITFAPSPELTISAESISVSSASALTPRGITQVSVSTLEGVRVAVPGLTIDIASIVSRASSISDGVEADSSATLTLGDVGVTIDGEKHRGYLDNTGVHVGEPNSPGAIPSDVRLPLSRKVELALDQAGIALRLGSPVEIVEEGRAEAGIGGLVVDFESGRPPYPPLPPAPVELPPIDNHCFGGEAGPLKGFCIGPGVAPIPPGSIATSLSLGGADALAVGGRGFTFDPGTDPDLPPIDTGDGLGPPPVGGPAPGDAPPGGAPPGISSPQPQPVKLYGLVARMPAEALLGSGLFFVVLAIGFAWAPSLRP